MKNSLKSVSAEQIQTAIAKALGDLTGETYAVHVNSVQFGDFLTATEMSLSVRAKVELPDSLKSVATGG